MAVKLVVVLVALITVVCAGELTAEDTKTLGFSYEIANKETGDYQSRVETRTKDGVKGQYYIIDADGSNRTVEYVANEDGFKATVLRNGIELAPMPPMMYEVADAKTGDYKSRVETRTEDGVKGQYYVIDADGNNRTVDYIADQEGFKAVVLINGIEVTPTLPVTFEVANEHTGDYKNQMETRTDDGVKGQYSVIDADGSNRTVQYVANSEGFKAIVLRNGVEIAPTPPVMFEISNDQSGDYKNQIETRTNNGLQGQYSVIDADGSNRTVQYIADNEGFKAIVLRNGVEIAPTPPVMFEVSNDQTGDYKNQIETRTNNGVQGQYSVIDADGSNRTVQYIADNEGFKAIVLRNGVEIAPTPPVMFEVSNDQTGDYKNQIETRTNNGVQGQYSLIDADGSNRTVQYIADSEGFKAIVLRNGIETPATPPVTFEVQNVQTGDYKNQVETRTNDGVKGQYSLVDADGSNRTVQYVADSEGFKAIVLRNGVEIASVPPVTFEVANEKTGDYKNQMETRTSNGVQGQYSLIDADGSNRTVQYVADNEGFKAIVLRNGIEVAPTPPVAFEVANDKTGDYKNHIETRTSNGVKGQYSVIDADGSNRTVQYVADSEGFKAIVLRNGIEVPSIPHVSYQVADNKTGDYKSRVEIQTNDGVKGQYYVIDADGSNRTVEYVANEDGFKAVVLRNSIEVAPTPHVTYDVRNYNTGDIKNQAENGPIDGVNGQYTVINADGANGAFQYVVDNEGSKAVVLRDGVPVPQNVPISKPTTDFKVAPVTYMSPPNINLAPSYHSGFTNSPSLFTPWPYVNSLSYFN